MRLILVFLLAAMISTMAHVSDVKRINCASSTVTVEGKELGFVPFSEDGETSITRDVYVTVGGTCKLKFVFINSPFSQNAYVIMNGGHQYVPIGSVFDGSEFGGFTCPGRFDCDASNVCTTTIDVNSEFSGLIIATQVKSFSCSSLSTGAIAGIVVGSIIGVLIVVALIGSLIYWFVIKPKREAAANAAASNGAVLASPQIAPPQPSGTQIELAKSQAFLAPSE